MRHGEVKKQKGGRIMKKLLSADIGIVPAEEVRGPYSMLTLQETLVAHDLAGDETLLFIAGSFPADKKNVRVFHQHTKQELGQLPPPSRGFQTPFKFRLKTYQNLENGGSQGTVYVLDSVTPKDAGMHDPLILLYAYEYTKEPGLQTRLVEEYRIPSNTVPPNLLRDGTPPNGAIYVTSFAFIDDETIALADTLAGAIWLYDLKDQAISVGFTHDAFRFKPWPNDLAITLQDGSVQQGIISGWTHREREDLVSYLYRPPMAPGMPLLMPGLHGLAVYHKGSTQKVVFGSCALGGVYSMDVAELMRTDIIPWEKHFETMVPDISGVSDWIAEVQADTFNPGSPWVYFQRVTSKGNEPADPGFEQWRDRYNALYRVNMETREMQFVAEDWKLWDFNSNLNVIPWEKGFARLTSTPVQQHRMPDANGLIEDPDDYSRLPADFVFPVIDVKS
jgi:hypothetical protein